MSAVALMLLLCGWLVLAPTQVGGATSYVIVNGDSMQPAYARGDLVITRRADEYAVGDVAAYEHRDLGPVIHRIVGRSQSRYVLRGDANTWLDSHRPSEAQVMGRAWVHLPAVGRGIEKLRSGAPLVALCITLGVLVVMTLSPANRSNRRRPRRQPVRTGDAAGPTSFRHRRRQGGRRDLAAASAAVLLASMVLGVVAFSRPTTVPASHRADYTHTGTFGYSADAPPGLYDTDRVRTGQPVFRRVTDTVTLRFGYRLDTEHSTDEVHGQYRLSARITDPTNGWTRDLLLHPDTPFEGGDLTTSATLDLTEVQRLIAVMERRTGLHTDRYALTYAPRIEVRGVVGGRQLDETFTPRLAFWLDGLLLQLQAPTGTDGSKASPLQPSQAGGTTSSIDQPNTVPLLGLDLPVSAARRLALLGALLSAIGLLLAASPLIRVVRGDAVDRISARYGHLLVTIDRPPAAGRAAVHVETIGDLARVANATGRNILHRPDDDGDDYYVHEPDVLYHHRVRRDDDRLPTASLAGPHPLSA